MTKKERAAQAVALLKARYPEGVCSLEYERPYELLISTRLSAQCTDARVNIVTKELYQKYPTLESFAHAELEELEAVVKPCGFYHTKARDIISMCADILEKHGGVVPDTIEELTKLSGVGRKTANLVVGDIYGKPAIVTDTHCIRITGRLGLTSGTEEPVKVEDELRPLLDPAESNNFCHRLVLFGRDVCTARSPKCGECPLREICKSADKPDSWKKKKTSLKGKK
ncbi:MAG: endonuclease III [Oscillospiraceae bacterium]|jgi:endonuclease-3|nr:endonuclease III [Oscillospiraceae bacterium]